MSDSSGSPVRRRRWLPIILTGAVLAIVAILIVPYSLTRAMPAYWRTMDRDDPQVHETAADVEKFLSSQTTRVRPEFIPWAVELTEEQVNAWLTARLPLWLANQGVDEQVINAIPNVMVHFGEASVEVAAEVRLKTGRQIVRFVYTPQESRGGGAEPARLDLGGVYAGRLPIPAELAFAQVRSQLATEGARRGADRLHEVMQSIPLRYRLDDGRLVSVIDFDLANGRAVLFCRTELELAAR